MRPDLNENRKVIRGSIELNTNAITKLDSTRSKRYAELRGERGDHYGLGLSLLAAATGRQLNGFD
jgi:hypothetical protein